MLTTQQVADSGDMSPLAETIAHAADGLARFPEAHPIWFGIIIGIAIVVAINEVVAFADRRTSARRVINRCLALLLNRDERTRAQRRDDETFLALAHSIDPHWMAKAEARLATEEAAEGK